MAAEILVAVFGLSLLVIVHELGHYLAARYFGMRVLRFAIGLGPTLISYRPKGSDTTFQIGAIPLMAYVMVAGMNPAEDVDPDDPELFPNKGVFARIVTIFGGPFANYLAASVMVFGLALHGWLEHSTIEPMIVDRVEPRSPAAEAGLEVGDVIVEANGQAIENVEELIEVTKVRADQPTVYVVEREGKKLAPMTITPKLIAERGVIGVTARTKVDYVPMALPDAAKLALEYPFALTMGNLYAIGDLIKRRTTEGITGPVGMGKIMAEQAEKGLFAFVHILIAISVALGLFNLLPFPALDGGRLTFLGYELITRRRPNERIEMAVHAVGMIFLLSVIVLVTLRDMVG
ncbi:MAG: M50 family metallopeptidase [Myxococcales bacterium]|nr:M50 family metallopeptidase [Myxococcales bacterium]